jgi:hypothetical protein
MPLSSHPPTRLPTYLPTCCPARPQWKTTATGHALDAGSDVGRDLDLVQALHRVEGAGLVRRDGGVTRAIQERRLHARGARGNEL